MTDTPLPWRAGHNGTGCSVEGCGKTKLEALGLCRAHYIRQRRHGDPRLGGTSPGASLAWLRKVLESETDECVLWPFPLKEGSYGKVTIEGVRHGSNRLMCTWAHGEPPTPDHEAAHNCGRPACCNPRHIRWATTAENQADRVIHGTDARGEKCATAKLTAEQVRVIRALKGKVRQADLAVLCGVYFNHIGKIHRGEIWKDGNAD